MVNFDINEHADFHCAASPRPSPALTQRLGRLTQWWPAPHTKKKYEKHYECNASNQFVALVVYWERRDAYQLITATQSCSYREGILFAYLFSRTLLTACQKNRKKKSLHPMKNRSLHPMTSSEERLMRSLKVWCMTVQISCAVTAGYKKLDLDLGSSRRCGNLVCHMRFTVVCCYDKPVGSRFQHLW